MSESYALCCRELTKTFGSTRALNGIDIDLPAGQVLALLGPSGCGKTTVMRIIAGLESPDSGTIEIGGRTVWGPGVRVPPEKRRVGLVFQDYALFPHLNVRSNIAYGLVRGASKGRLAELVQLTGLQGLEDRMPHQLSGGQQQRVALARTLANDPALLLLDEPFSNLDVKLREGVRDEIRRLLKATGTTAVFVTHDQEEAFVLGDTIAVMNAGAIEQVGQAEDLYNRPASRFVAGFVGTATFLPARVSGCQGDCAVGQFETDGAIQGDCEVMVRPGDVELGKGSIVASVKERTFLGQTVLYTLSLPSGTEIRAFESVDARWRAQDSVTVGLKKRRYTVFARSERTLHIP